MAAWRASLGAWCEADGVRFRVWAPKRSRVDVIIESDGGTSMHPLTRATDGTFSAFIAGITAGNRYRYRLDGEGAYPDPTSRFQPEGVHGPSEVVDASRFEWSDTTWQGVRLDELVVYELHVGTFSPRGMFDGLLERLAYLRDLGVTAIESMPVADFPGARNWGYDGVALFAPARCYGRPDDLRRVVDAAHRLGLGVLLDVVYNHLGPDGNYLECFSPYYFSQRHQTPWGAAVNLDGPHSEMVRAFFIENALHWVHEYHVDGLRFDATHALIDDGPRHFLAELSSRVRSSVSGRTVVLIAEDHRNLSHMVRSEAEGGWGLDAVWADDFHHQMQRALAGDREGYYEDYSGSVADVATTLRRGWFFCGEYSTHLRRPRGTDPSGLAPQHFVICLQNHDQVGNRAFGERLHHQIDLAAYRAATVLLLCAPQTPLLFMGQEWAASAPFLFFTDHDAKLGKLITAGRRREFKSFAAFADATVRERIPDPQAAATFERSRLNWSESVQEPHASTLRLYQELLALRHAEPARQGSRRNDFDVTVAADGALLGRRVAAGSTLVAVVQLLGAGAVRLNEPGRFEQVLSTEDQRFAADPLPVRIAPAGDALVLHFTRPGAVILRYRSE